MRVFLCFLVLVLVSCSSGGGSGCEDARTSIVKSIDDVCKEPELANSGFCTQCVANNFYSTSGASDCVCTTLNFDQDFCSFVEGSDAKPATRAAILEADRACPQFVTMK